MIIIKKKIAQPQIMNKIEHCFVRKLSLPARVHHVVNVNSTVTASQAARLHCVNDGATDNGGTDIGFHPNATHASVSQ